MNEKIKMKIEKLYDDGYKILEDFISKDGKKKSILSQEYQIWYTITSIVVKEVLPNRYEEFVECYKNTKRKNISYDTYSMSDYLTGIGLNNRLANPETAGLIRFKNQLNIVKSISENIDNVLFNIKSSIEFEVLDDELLSSRKLWKKGYLRSAGALCGVVLEKHFSTMLKNHNLKLTKKEPCISDYNELFKQENIYDIINWRFIQHLGDIRNLCDHNKDREPTKDEVDELIKGTDKVIKTIF